MQISRISVVLNVSLQRGARIQKTVCKDELASYVY
jgi:hypothetical protein